MTKEEFQIIYNLSSQQPWLVGKDEVLIDLLFEEAKEPGQRTLLIELISKFLYLNHDNFATSLFELAQSITTDPTLSDETTAVVALTRSSKSDSGQFVLYSLKPLLSELGWNKFIDCNSADRCYKKVKQSTSIRNVVLVDEVIGSGSTVLLTYRDLQKVFRENGLDVTIKIKSIIACQQGIDSILAEGVDLECIHSLKKGISDSYTSDRERGLKLDCMRQLENALEPKIGDRELPSLGHGGTEALYCREGGNTPNSVFPVFWWPEFRGTRERKTILHRARKDL
ncbi:MAG: hypothetical protein R3273_06595 [Pseudidiomarina maritima]|nr:hypothetical protein [Pseudidiomarina maritima]